MIILPSAVPYHNVVRGVNVGIPLDLKKIVTTLGDKATMRDWNGVSIVKLTLRNPLTTSFIFANGRVICTGAQSEEESELAAVKHIDHLRLSGHYFSQFATTILNVTGIYSAPLPLRLSKIESVYACERNTRLDSVTFRVVNGARVFVLRQGTIIISKAMSVRQVDETMNEIRPIIEGAMEERKVE